jgi:hypothetical protein
MITTFAFKKWQPKVLLCFKRGMKNLRAAFLDKSGLLNKGFHFEK